eukprot:7195277-Pyramimonas_sp.AAC.1
MIIGLTSRELLTLRRALIPYRGGSLDGRMLLYGDPAWQASVAPMLQYAKALWRSLVEPGTTVLSWRFLQRAWDAVTAQFPILDQAQWKRSAGPIHRAMLCLSRLGWSCTNFKTFRDDMHVEIDLFY